MRTYHFWGSFCLVILFTACKKAENVRVHAAKPERKMDTYSGKVVHLYRDTVYTLSSPFVRHAGEELVIEGGTLIKINPIGGSITINKGGVIIASGTAEQPIVFTSITPTGNQQANWGGITINGKGVDNTNPPTGGADPTDFSGSLNFVRIEFAGLRLNAVGNRSIIEHIQVSYASRSSFEIVGGSFNARYLVSYACGGPADFYISNGYNGKMQYMLAYRHPFFGQTGSNPANALAGVFIQNHPFNHRTAKPNTFPVISNLSVIGPNAQNGSVSLYGDTTKRSGALITTGNSNFAIRNAVLMGFPGAACYLDDSLTAKSIRFNMSELRYSVFHSNNRNRVFYLSPQTYIPFGSSDFENYMV
jgi:hypothetical protein